MLNKQRYDGGDIRHLNAVSVLNQLRMNGRMSRANIAGKLGMTRATVSNIVAELIRASLVIETEYVVGRTGRPGLQLILNAKFGCMIAVDIGLDRIALVLADVGRKELWRVEVPLAVGATAQVALESAEALVEQALARGEQAGLKCRGVCVALAGLVDSASGSLAYGPTSGWEDVSLRADWEARFDVQVTVENEAHAGATGVYHFGAGAEVDHLIYLSVGVGLAAGIIVDGVLLRGARGFAGQVGHTLFAREGVACGCGKSGCWVTEVGASAIVRKLAAKGVDVSHGAELTDDWLELVAAKAHAGDACVMAVLDGVARQIGQGLAQFVQTFNPSLVVVGGRVGKLLQLVEPAIREAMLAETLPSMADSLELVVSGSGEDPLQGCLATVFDGLMKDPSVGARAGLRRAV